MRKRHAIWMLIPAVAAGCSQQVGYTPARDHQTLEAAEFMHYMAQQPMVTYDELCRATLLLADGEETKTTFEERVSELASREVVRSEWQYDPDHLVDRGTLAYMIFRACKMRGGLNTLVSGWTGVACGRYALKEVIRRRIMRYGLAYQIPTGGEVVRALAKADDYLAAHGGYETTRDRFSTPQEIE